MPPPACREPAPRKPAWRKPEARKPAWRKPAWRKPAWIDLDGLANLRDLGGTPTVGGGSIMPGRLLRSDNLQTLTDGDIEELLRRGLTDVVDLRSGYEIAAEGPGPLTRRLEVTIYEHSLLPEQDLSEEEVAEEALPWVGLAPSVRVRNSVASTYLSYLADRPDSVVAALRRVAYAEGATLVHCAAGKDRTGAIVALALLLAGAEQQAVVDDYAASSQRMPAIIARLAASPTYTDNVSTRPLASHLTYPDTMAAFVEYVERDRGGVERLLGELGWTAADTSAMRARLLD